MLFPYFEISSTSILGLGKSQYLTLTYGDCHIWPGPWPAHTSLLWVALALVVFFIEHLCFGILMVVIFWSFKSSSCVTPSEKETPPHQATLFNSCANHWCFSGLFMVCPLPPNSHTQLG